MTQLFPNPTARMAYDGLVLLQQDGPVGQVYAFPNTSVRFNKGENNAYPASIDANAIMHMKALGVKMGALSMSFNLQIDRRIDTFLTAGFGPRTNGQLTPWVMNIIPYNGATPVKATGVWFSDFGMSGRYGTRGDDQLITCNLSAMVMDPDNFYGAGTLTAPATAATAGLGLSSFSQMGFNDGQASGAVYDAVRSFGFSLSNGLRPQPSMLNAANRIGAGCVPSMIRGGLSILQIDGATTATPQAAGKYPYQLTLPSGDGTKTLKIDASVSYDANGKSLLPEDFTNSGINYTLFSTSAGATATAVWPFTTTYV